MSENTSKETSPLRECRVCKEKKPPELFKRRRVNGGWRTLWECCKRCDADRVLRRTNNPEARKKQAEVRRQRSYGVSGEEYDLLWESQNGLCAICKNPESRKPFKPGWMPPTLSVDHCHKTGKIRKLLCSKCNTGIGQFQENVALLMAAIAYLLSYYNPPETDFVI